MAKLAFFAAFLVVLVALSAAEGDSTLHLQCQRELQESSLNACQQVVDHQLAVELPFLLPRSRQLRTGVQVQCCQQLRDISRVCRAAAISQIVRQYGHEAVVPLREDPYYLGEDEEEQGGGSYYPGETYPQQEQGWEQQQGHGSYQPSETYTQQQEQGSYRPSQTYGPQQEQGSYRPSQTYDPQQHQQGSYRPSQTYHPQQHQAARLEVVARARQVAAQLPAMCRLEGSAFSIISQH